MFRSGSAGTVIKVNAIVYLAALALVYIVGGISGYGDAIVGISVTLMFLIVLHVGLCLLLGIIFWVKKDKEYAKGFLLSGLVVLLIGVSTCFGGALFIR